MFSLLDKSLLEYSCHCVEHFLPDIDTLVDMAVADTSHSVYYLNKSVNTQVRNDRTAFLLDNE